MAWDFYSGFTSEEYRIALVDFIVALRRTKGRGRRTLRSPPSPSSGLHLIHPGDPLRRGILAAAGLRQYSIPVSGADCSSPLRRDVWGNCVRAEVACVSENLAGHMSFVFHWWWDGLFVPAATWRFVIDIRRITADRAISSNFVGCKPISPIVPGAEIL